MRYLACKCLALALLMASSLTVFADSKIKTRNTAMGHSSESTVYIKGARERTEGSAMGMGPSLVTIMQCDQKRVITYNPQARTCMVTPLASEEGEKEAAPAASAGRAGKGGTITFTVTAADTGERQQIYGLTARHVKSSMVAESSADACGPVNMRTETDGWYADISPALTCSMGTAPPQARMREKPGCQDKVRFRRSGLARMGYPLKQMITITAEGHTFTSMSEVVELTSTPLEASLFEMPAGCRQVTSYMELMGGPGGMVGGRPMPTGEEGEGGMSVPAPAPTPSAPPPPVEPAPKVAPVTAVPAKTAGVLRVGVTKIHDATGQYLPIDNLRLNLMSEITLRHMEAIGLDTDPTQQSSVLAEAGEKQCDYVLLTDAVQVKDPGTGGIPLPVALRGTTLDPNKYQALLQTTLFRMGRPQPELKQVPVGADADQFGVNAVMAGFEKEADKVAEQVKKDHEPSKPAPRPVAMPAPRKPK